MQIRGVIFDLFHTLTARESEWSDLPSTAAVLGIDRRTWDDALTAQSRWRLVGAERDPYIIVRTLAHTIDPTISETRIRAATDTRIKRFRRSLRQIPAENLDTLRHLRARGYQLGLISNADPMEVAAWADSPLSGAFDAEVFSCTAGCVKPEPAIYRQCLDALGLEPHQCLFVGDGGSNELVGAKEIGLSTVFMSGVITELWPDTITQRIQTADHHVTTIPEVIALRGG
jgi:putative hydrolase of the HAD superfamily